MSPASSLLRRLATAPQYPTQGATAFIDLARREVTRAYTPRQVVQTLLEGRGGNMFHLYNLLDTSGGPLSPTVPLIFGNGVLTGIVPSAARGNVSSWSPETGVLMDSNCGDYFPSFLKLSGWDRLVISGRAAEWTALLVEGERIAFLDARAWAGLDNLELRERVARELGGAWAKDLAMACITGAGERGVLSAAIMGGPKACWARGGTGAKMGSLGLKAIVVRGFDPRLGAGAHAEAVKPYNRELAGQLLETAVVKHALKVRGTPFLYRPSRLLGAMGTRNNQENTWSEALDAENLDRFRPGMAGCFRCPVNCRPLNDLGTGGRYDSGDGPEYVTLGKFGPNLGIADPAAVIRLNNVCNDLGLDTASSGSAIAWAMELWQRGLIDGRTTGGLELAWGDDATVEKLLFMTARREGFGDTLALTTRAVEAGRYPEEALRYRMAVKRLFQSDPHDARILKAFALGLAVATRGMDHLRNRATLEINARINDDPAFKRRLYGGEVDASPTSYRGKELAVRVCEDVFAVGDAVGMCRFTTRLFNSPSLPGLEEFATQIRNVTGLEIDLGKVGLAITHLERTINHALGVRRGDDTLPRRWFEEGLGWGAHRGEKIDALEFDRMRSRFYALSGLDDDGQPALEARARLLEIVAGFAVAVRAPFLPGGLVVTSPVRDVPGLLDEIGRLHPGAALGEYNVAINDELLLHGDDRPVASGDRVELVVAMSGG
jgi:aldehyde:ferredoxin oxidoreductase